MSDQLFPWRSAMNDLIYLDSALDTHRKVQECSLEAEAVYVNGLCWAQRNGTRGFLPIDAVRQLTKKAKNPGAIVKELVGLHLWDVNDGQICVHDFQTFQAHCQKRIAGLMGMGERWKGDPLAYFDNSDSVIEPDPAPSDLDAYTTLIAPQDAISEETIQGEGDPSRTREDTHAPAREGAGLVKGKGKTLSREEYLSLSLEKERVAAVLEIEGTEVQLATIQRVIDSYIDRAKDNPEELDPVMVARRYLEWQTGERLKQRHGEKNWVYRNPLDGWIWQMDWCWQNRQKYWAKSFLRDKPKPKATLPAQFTTNIPVWRTICEALCELSDKQQLPKRQMRDFAFLKFKATEWDGKTLTLWKEQLHPVERTEWPPCIVEVAKKQLGMDITVEVDGPYDPDAWWRKRCDGSVAISKS